MLLREEDGNRIYQTGESATARNGNGWREMLRSVGILDNEEV